MVNDTIRDIYAFFISLVGMVLIYGSMWYYGPIFNTPRYIILAILLLMIVGLIDMFDRTIKEAKIKEEKFNKNNE